jgi:hypothetical protein
MNKIVFKRNKIEVEYELRVLRGFGIGIGISIENSQTSQKYRVKYWDLVILFICWQFFLSIDIPIKNKND